MWEAIMVQSEKDGFNEYDELPLLDSNDENLENPSIIVHQLSFRASCTTGVDLITSDQMIVDPPPSISIEKEKS
jgi:hypothetical protein